MPRVAARDTGAHCEDLACTHLQHAGLILVARNVQCRHGELDLVMLDGEIVVFVEVRYRRGLAFGDGIDSIGSGKRQRLLKAAALWLADTPRFARRTCRFDVVAVTGTLQQPRFDWCKNAFDAF